MELVVLVCIIVLCAVLGLYAHAQGEQPPVEWAEREFRALRVEAPDPACSFDGRSAVVVHEERACLEDQSQVVEVTRYARNAHGEYFFFISKGSGKPYFKHISQAAAQAALGKKYLTPPAGPA